MSKVMSLAKNYDPKKTPFPAIAQIKYDGVPVTFKKIGAHCIAVSRQSEVLKSVGHITKLLNEVLDPGDEVTMECLVKGLVHFKDISGVIRRGLNNKQAGVDFTDERIFGKLFDGAEYGKHSAPYEERFKWLIEVSNATYRLNHTLKPVQVALGTRVENELEMFTFYNKNKASYAQVQAKYPNLGIKLEGIMLHDVSRPYTPGKRIWGMSRYKPQPTIDLRVVSYEEALAGDTKDGPPKGTRLGMVGRINVELNRRQADGSVARSVIGIGPGKLTHSERRALWRAAQGHSDDLERIDPDEHRIAEVQYMPDESYEALRQPTFQRWRPDKTEADVLEY